MKNVLLLVHDDPGQEARLQAALDLTRALGGHLICLDVAVPPFLMGDPYGIPIEGQLVEEERTHQAENRATLQARLAREDVPWTWVDAGGGFADALNRAAGSADLVVVNRQLDSFAPFDMRTVAGDVVVSSGRAVVAVDLVRRERYQTQLFGIIPTAAQRTVLVRRLGLVRLRADPAPAPAWLPIALRNPSRVWRIDAVQLDLLR